MLLPLRYYGDPILRKKCKPVKEITAEIRQLVADMIETMDASDGIGIAAPQIGYDLALFVLRNYITNANGELAVSDPLVFINPQISSVSSETALEEEGCLSIPKIKAQIKRPVKITLEATDINGNLFREELEGYNARVRLHENDHLNGVLFVDRLDAAVRRELEPLLKKIKKNTTIVD